MMTYSNDVLRRARRALESQKAEYEARQEANLQEIYEKLPRVREIDKELRLSMVQAAQAAFVGGDQSAMEQVKTKNLSLQAERKSLICAHFPPEYLDEKPLCPHCGGSGYVGSTMCSCLQALCREELKKTISLFSAGERSFDDFRLDYYSDAIVPQYGVSCRTIMEKTFAVCKRYAGEFTPDSGNLLFVGGTGLGKTFLSACIAREVAEKGYGVAYESAPRLFAKLEKDHFRPDEESAQPVAELYDKTLLIIDDLGTELTGAFTVSALYSLINERLLTGKPTIISTNLNIGEIRQRYSPQIASRLEGSFQRLTFVGEDIRVLKNK